RLNYFEFYYCSLSVYLLLIPRLTSPLSRNPVSIYLNTSATSSHTVLKILNGIRMAINPKIKKIALKK
ncbi:MAG: hypothetical protein LBU94_03285, partial [Clostridiales bacterium]|nr:hypothetical protein [Clostridiales bacterium]